MSRPPRQSPKVLPARSATENSHLEATMTQRDFELLALMVRRLRASAPEEAVDEVAIELSELCETTNRRFDRWRFLGATGFNFAAAASVDPDAALALSELETA